MKIFYKEKTTRYSGQQPGKKSPLDPVINRLPTAGLSRVNRWFPDVACIERGYRIKKGVVLLVGSQELRGLLVRLINP